MERLPSDIQQKILKIAIHNNLQEKLNAMPTVHECKRLMERKLAAVRDGHKRTLLYLNENEWQIPGQNHKLEHKAFALIRVPLITDALFKLPVQAHYVTQAP